MRQCLHITEEVQGIRVTCSFLSDAKALASPGQYCGEGLGGCAGGGAGWQQVHDHVQRGRAAVPGDSRGVQGEPASGNVPHPYTLNVMFAGGAS